MNKLESVAKRYTDTISCMQLKKQEKSLI